MKIILKAVLLLFLFSGAGFSLNPDYIFKAGPTALHEELALPWLEVVLAPGNIEAGQEFNLSVNSTTKLKKVSLSLDHGKVQKLKTSDLAHWNQKFVLPKQIKSGVHFLNVTIQGLNGKRIERILAFRAYRDLNIDKNDFKFPVTLKKDVRLGRNKILKKGQYVDAVYRKTYIWVKGEGGAEGWVNEADVVESVNDIYLAAYKNYNAKNYDKAISLFEKAVKIDPLNADAHYWLAKSYDNVGEDSKTIEHIIQAIRIDPHHKNANWLAGSLAQNYFTIGQAAAARRDYKKAAWVFEQIVALKPASISYRIELGKTYEKMGMAKKAQDAYKQVLLYDPNNQQAHSLLKTDYYKLLASEEEKIDLAEGQQAGSASANPAAVKYINMVKNRRTEKGTLISKAIQSVVSMTRSLGTSIFEDGWKTDLTGEGFLVTYACRQEQMGRLQAEDFTFKVNLDNNIVTPWNHNAKLLMLRW